MHATFKGFLIVQKIVNTLGFKDFCKDITKRPGWNVPRMSHFITNVTFPLCKQCNTDMYMDINDSVWWMLVQLCSRRRHEYPLTLHRLDLRPFCRFSKHSHSWHGLVCVSHRSAYVDNEYLQNTITTSQGGKGNVSFAHGLKMLDNFSPLTCSCHSIFFESDARFRSGSALTP